MNEQQKASLLAPILEERRRHLARLPQLTELGREEIMRALAGKPVRTPSGGPVSLVSRAVFRKSPLTNDTESSHEFEDLFIRDADPAVVDIRTQAMDLKLTVLEPMPDGSTRRHGYKITPDQLVVEQTRVVLRDLMPEAELEETARLRPWFIHFDDEAGVYRCPVAEAAAAAYGIDYEIKSSARHSRILARGLRYLWDFAELDVESRITSAIAELVEASQGITIAEVVEEGAAREPELGWSVDHVLAAVAQHFVFIDLERYTPSDHAHARLYTDAATARAHELAHPPSWAAGSARPARPSIAPGTRYSMEGRAFELFICVGDEVHFTVADEPGCPVRIYARGDFERLVAAGRMVQDSGESLADVARAAAAAAWLAAPRKRRVVALARFRAVEVFRANRDSRRRGGPVLPVPVVEKSVPSKATLERWLAASEVSAREWGDVLLGLLPKVRPGRPGLRAAAWHEAIIAEEIDGYYATGVGRGKKATIIKIQERCRKKNKLEVPDRKTILTRFAMRDPYKLRKAHDGDKAAYADKPYLPVDPDAMPVRGEYPFQRVQYDTTTADERVLDPLSGRDLGRPTLGVLVDSYSDRALVHGWGFGERPRVGDLLDVLVDCAERYGRLPEELILDNGIGHWAEAIQVFAAAHGMHITYRPTAQSRFGGPVELTFARLSDGLLHHLAGNTRATKLVRTVTSRTDPAKLAVLSLAELDYLVTLWFELVDDARIVKERGQTAKRAFELGLAKHGNRAARHLAVDDLFRAQAIVVVGERTSQGVKGIELDNLTYQHECLRHAGVKGERIEVARHHRDVTRIWAFVPAHRHERERVEAGWVEARCGLLASLRFVSEVELAIATRTVRERLTDDNRRRAVRESAIAKVLLAAETLEELALERKRSLALAEVSTALPAASAEAPVTYAAAAPAAPAALSTPETDDPIAAARRAIEAAYYRKEA